MATTPAPAPEAQATLSPFGRVIGVFFNPKPTFADIAQRPSWVAPLVLLFVIYMGLNLALVQHADWVEVSKEQIAKISLPPGRSISCPKTRKRVQLNRPPSAAKSSVTSVA